MSPAVLFDFAGVLTTSMLDSFAAFCAGAGLPRDAVVRCLAEDEPAARALAALERGEIGENDCERVLGVALTARHAPAVPVPADGLVAALTAGLRPDHRMLELVARTRAHVPVGLLSNSFGARMYDGYDLQQRFDAVLLSGDLGIRKPSRAIYRLAAERLGCPPGACIMVDDLALNVVGARRAGMRALLHRDADETAAQLGVALHALTGRPATAR